MMDFLMEDMQCAVWGSGRGLEPFGAEPVSAFLEVARLAMPGEWEWPSADVVEGEVRAIIEGTFPMGSSSDRAGEWTTSYQQDSVVVLLVALGLSALASIAVVMVAISSRKRSGRNQKAEWAATARRLGLE